MFCIILLCAACHTCCTGVAASPSTSAVLKRHAPNLQPLAVVSPTKSSHGTPTQTSHGSPTRSYCSTHKSLHAAPKRSRSPIRRLQKSSMSALAKFVYVRSISQYACVLVSSFCSVCGCVFATDSCVGVWSACVSVCVITQLRGPKQGISSPLLCMPPLLIDQEHVSDAAGYATSSSSVL